MEYHYKAFISYRHAEMDTKIAEEVQNRIERYIIPGSIRRELGIKSIGRVFRDKDELPSTSDLNDNIKDAIRNSEFLICICSPRYIESIWCMKEIEFFLESHDKHHILTVLAEGDPYKVVPEILCKEMVTVKDENGNDVTIEAKLEPLSCDYRGDRHRARTEEFPRLAAVLIGCRYADLRQKMRKRRMRIIAAVSVFAAALAAYFAWSYVNIQINYRRSLINQSQYLASSAREALSVNDNMLAAQLSLAALPDQGRERPVVPEAVYTLSQAIGAYQNRSVLNFRGVATYTTHTGTLGFFTVTNDAHYMAMISSAGEVEVCDLVQNTMPYTISSYKLFGSAADRVTGCGKDRFMIYGQGVDDIAMVRYDDGEVLWHQQFRGSNKRVLALGKEGSYILLLTDEEAVILDSENGEILRRCSIQDASGGEAQKAYKPSSYRYLTARQSVSVNEEKASCAILCEQESDSFDHSVTGILTYYYETGKTVWTPFTKENYQFEDISLDTEGNILLAYAEKDSDYCLNSYYKTSYDSGSAEFGNGKVSLMMIREGTGEVIWQNTVEYMGLRESDFSCFEIRTMPAGEEGPARKVVLGAVSNKIVLWDAADGKKIKDLTLSDWVVSVDDQETFESHARVNGASGTQYYFSCYSSNYSGMTYMDGPVDNTFFYHGNVAFDELSQFIVLQGNTIRVFKAEQGDSDFSNFGFEMPETTILEHLIFGSYLVFTNFDGKIYIYDMESEEKLHEIQLDGTNSHYYMCSTTDQSCFYLSSNEDYSGKYVIRVNLEEGTYEKIDLTQVDFLTGAGRWKFDCSHYIVSGDYLFYRASNYDQMVSYWFRYSLKDGSTTMLELPFYEDIEYRASSLPKCLFAEDGSKGVLFFDNAIYLADFGSGTVTAVDAEFPGVTYSTRRESDGMFVCYYQGAQGSDSQGAQEGDSRKELRAYDAGGKLLWEIDNLPEEITAMRFYKDALVVGTNNMRLYAYDARSGARKGVIDIGIKMYHTNVKIYDGTKGELIVDNGMGSVMMVDYESWALTGAAYDAVGYCPALKRIIFKVDNSGDEIGYCRYYTVDDLVEKGKAFVGEQTMSEADMATYGLN